jgi:hypothetical protein
MYKHGHLTANPWMTQIKNNCGTADDAYLVRDRLSRSVRGAEPLREGQAMMR